MRKRLNGLDDKLSSEEVVLNYTPKENLSLFHGNVYQNHKTSQCILCVHIMFYVF